jgi:site-specific DNA recombinase
VDEPYGSPVVVDRYHTRADKAHTAWGRRARELEPNLATAPVGWMFAQRLAGHSVARITQALDDAGIRARRPPTRSGTLT